MKRVNYAPSRAERIAGVRLHAAIPSALRVPIAALGGVLALAGALWGVQEARLDAAAREAAAYSERLAGLEPSLIRVRAAERDIARMRALERRIAEISSSGSRGASEIAALGNALPPDAWLTALRADRDTLTLDGRGTRLAVVGDALAALGALGTYRSVHLASARADAPRGGVIYGLTLERSR